MNNGNVESLGGCNYISRYVDVAYYLHNRDDFDRYR
jgi:hypothetical protein